MSVFSAVAGNELTPIQQQMHDQINCNKRVLPALFHLRCPSQSHQRSARVRTSDDSYVYQLSLVVATAIVSYSVGLLLLLHCYCCTSYIQTEVRS